MAASAARPKRGTPWLTLLKLCKPDLPLLLCAFTSLTIAASGDALLPALQGAALNTALGLETQGHTSLRSALANLLGVAIGTALFTGIRGFAFWISGARLVARLRAALFEALLRQPQAFHDEQGPGELSTRLATDCVKLGDVLSLNVNIVLRQVIQSVAGIAVVCRLNGKLAALVLCGVLVRSIFAHYYSKASRRISQAQQSALAASSGVAEQCLSLIRVVRSHGNERHEQERYTGQLDRLLRLETEKGAIYGMSRVFNGAVNAITYFGILALGGAFVSAGVLPKEAVPQRSTVLAWRSTVPAQRPIVRAQRSAAPAQLPAAPHTYTAPHTQRHTHTAPHTHSATHTHTQPRTPTARAGATLESHR